MNKTEKTTFTVPSSAELEQLAELHKAMGDYTRIRILWYLMQKEYCVSDLAQKMEITESAISHQLRALRIARLVQSIPCRMSISGGFLKKPMTTFQKDKSTAPVLVLQGLRRIFHYRAS